MPYARTRLGRLFYEERGSPGKRADRAIVLCHGLLFDGGMWRNQIEPLSRLGRVVVVDGPGHGKSEVPPQFSIEQHADAMRDLLDEVNVTRAVMMGLSWGGMMAMRFGMQHADRVAALALIDTSAEDESPKRKRVFRALVPMISTWGIPRFVAERRIAPMIFAPTTLATRPELAREFASNLNGFSRVGIARASSAVLLHRSRVLERLDTIRAPTLVVCGSEDRATSARKSRAIARHIPGAKIEWIEGAGHMSVLEKPAEVNAVLEKFARQQLAERPL